MPIFNTKKKAKAKAEELAKNYNIKYSPEGDAFTIHGKEDPTGEAYGTDEMVAADKWLPSLSRKKRLTTKYYQKLAQKQNLEAIHKAAKNEKAKFDALQLELDKEKERSAKLLINKTKQVTTDATVDNTIKNNKSGKKKKNTVVDNTDVTKKATTDKKDAFTWTITKDTPTNNALKWTITNDQLTNESDISIGDKEDVSTDAYWNYLSDKFGYKSIRNTPGFSKRTDTPANEWIIKSDKNPVLTVDYDNRYSSETIPPVTEDLSFTPFGKFKKLVGKDTKSKTVTNGYSNISDNIKELSQDNITLKDVVQAEQEDKSHLMIKGKMYPIKNIVKLLNTKGLLSNEFLNADITRDIKPVSTDSYKLVNILPRHFRTIKDAQYSLKEASNKYKRFFRVMGDNSIYEYDKGKVTAVKDPYVYKNNYIVEFIK